MIKFISSWAGNIVTAVVAISILEMLLPSGSSKKYIKTIIGIYLVYIMISPVIKLISGGEIKIDYSEYEKYFNETTSATDFEIPSLEETYQKQLERQIKNELKQIGYDSEVLAKLDLEKGIIDRVDIKAKKSKEDSIIIEKVEIGQNYGNDFLNKQEIMQIKQKINEVYGIEFDNIYVNSN